MKLWLVEFKQKGRTKMGRRRRIRSQTLAMASGRSSTRTQKNILRAFYQDTCRLWVYGCFTLVYFMSVCICMHWGQPSVFFFFSLNIPFSFCSHFLVSMSSAFVALRLHSVLLGPFLDCNCNNHRFKYSLIFIRFCYPSSFPFFPSSFFDNTFFRFASFIIYSSFHFLPLILLSVCSFNLQYAPWVTQISLLLSFSFLLCSFFFEKDVLWVSSI